MEKKWQASSVINSEAINQEGAEMTLACVGRRQRSPCSCPGLKIHVLDDLRKTSLGKRNWTLGEKGLSRLLAPVSRPDKFTNTRTTPDGVIKGSNYCPHTSITLLQQQTANTFKKRESWRQLSAINWWKLWTLSLFVCVRVSSFKGYSVL